MSTLAELTKEAAATDEEIADSPSTHGSLIDVVTDYRSADAVSKELISHRKMELHQRPTSTSETISALQSLRRADAGRFVDSSTLDSATALGVKAFEEGIERPKRGRIDSAGLISKASGDALALSSEHLEDLATNSFAAEAGFSFRAPLFLSPDLVERLRLQDNPDRNFQDATTGERRSHVQASYEISLALGALKRTAPMRYDSYVNSSSTLRSLGAGNLKPALQQLPIDFQARFIEEQKDTAWSWRNQLEPGKANRPTPELSLASVAMRNKMGLGMLEYLLPTGKTTLEYMRSFGQHMEAARDSFRRTEIKEEHLDNFLVGVPLRDGQALTGSSSLLIHLAREHHELWRFSRELSWLESDPAWHQPERNAHVPWGQLDTATKNRDILNIFGVAYMLGKMQESDFNTLTSAALPGNPHGFEFRKIEIQGS